MNTQEETYTTEHKPPVEASNVVGIGDVLKGDIHHVAKHNPERCPGLPHHNEGTTNERWCAPSSEKKVR